MQIQQLLVFSRKAIESMYVESINGDHKPQNDRHKCLNVMIQPLANKPTTQESGVPVWVFSLIYSGTTPSLSARFSDTPHVTASSLPPRTPTTCQWGCDPDETAVKGHSRSHHRLHGSREGVKDNQPVPLLPRPQLPTEVLHEKSCLLDRWCWDQNQAPGWRAHLFLVHQDGY